MAARPTAPGCDTARWPIRRGPRAGNAPSRTGDARFQPNAPDSGTSGIAAQIPCERSRCHPSRGLTARRAHARPSRARSISAEAALARAKAAATTLVLVGPPPEPDLARERVTGREHVLGRGERRTWRSRRWAIASARTTGRSLGTILRTIHAQATSPEIVAVELSNRVCGLCVGSKLGESESA